MPPPLLINWSGHDLDLWALTLKTSSTKSTHMTNVCGKFNWKQLATVIIATAYITVKHGSFNCICEVAPPNPNDHCSYSVLNLLIPLSALTAQHHATSPVSYNGLPTLSRVDACDLHRQRCCTLKAEHLYSCTCTRPSATVPSRCRCESLEHAITVGPPWSPSLCHMSHIITFMLRCVSSCYTGTLTVARRSAANGCCLVAFMYLIALRVCVIYCLIGVSTR